MLNIVDKIFKVSTLFSLFVIVLGNFYEYSFYHVFSINIYDYISPTEILSLFLPDLLKVILFIFLIFLACWLVFLEKFQIITIENFLKPQPRVKRTKPELLRLIIRLIIILVLIGILIGINETYLDYNSEKSVVTNNNAYLIRSVLGALIIPYLFVYGLMAPIKSNELNLGVFTMGLLFVSHLVFVNSFAEYIATKEKNDPQHFHYTIITNDNIYYTNDSLKYIGSTNSSIFLFTQVGETQKSIIIPKSSLTKPLEIEYQMKEIYQVK